MNHVLDTISYLHCADFYKLLYLASALKATLHNLKLKFFKLLLSQT